MCPLTERLLLMHHVEPMCSISLISPKDLRLEEIALSPSWRDTEDRAGAECLAGRSYIWIRIGGFSGSSNLISHPHPVAGDPRPRPCASPLAVSATCLPGGLLTLCHMACWYQRCGRKQCPPEVHQQQPFSTRAEGQCLGARLGDTKLPMVPPHSQLGNQGTEDESWACIPSMLRCCQELGAKGAGKRAWFQPAMPVLLGLLP